MHGLLACGQKEYLDAGAIRLRLSTSSIELALSLHRPTTFDMFQELHLV
jgi:hypothetical protein